MKPIHVFLIALLFFIIGIVITNLYIKNKNVCYALPTEGGPENWGKFYWNGLHDIANRVPCSLCRSEGVQLISFVHDYVNEKISKPIFDENNYSNWLNKFSEIKNKRETNIQ